MKQNKTKQNRQNVNGEGEGPNMFLNHKRKINWQGDQVHPLYWIICVQWDMSD